MTPSSVWTYFRLSPSEKRREFTCHSHGSLLAALTARGILISTKRLNALTALLLSGAPLIAHAYTSAVAEEMGMRIQALEASTRLSCTNSRVAGGRAAEAEHTRADAARATDQLNLRISQTHDQMVGAADFTRSEYLASLRTQIDAEKEAHQKHLVPGATDLSDAQIQYEGDVLTYHINLARRAELVPLPVAVQAKAHERMQAAYDQLKELTELRDKLDLISAHSESCLGTARKELDLAPTIPGGAYGGRGGAVGY